MTTEAPMSWEQVVDRGLESIWNGDRDRFEKWLAEGLARIAEDEADDE